MLVDGGLKLLLAEGRACAAATSCHHGTQADLPIQLRGGNAPALPENRKGKTGRLLRLPKRDYPAATVANFSTAVLNIMFKAGIHMPRVPSSFPFVVVWSIFVRMHSPLFGTPSFKIFMHMDMNIL